MAGEDDPLRSDARRIRVHERAHGDQRGRYCTLARTATQGSHMRTLRIFRFPQQHARLLAKYRRSIHGRDVGRAVPEVPLELMDVVRPAPAATRVLAVDRVYAQPPRADAQKERVLA